MFLFSFLFFAKIDGPASVSSAKESDMADRSIEGNANKNETEQELEYTVVSGLYSVVCLFAVCVSVCLY